MKADNQLRKRQLYIFFILSYVIFWILLGLTGLAISLNVPQRFETVLKNICAWAPTFAVLILFKKLYPDKTLPQLIKDNFSQKIKWQTITYILVIQIAVYLLAVLSCTIFNNVEISSLTFIQPSAILPAFIVTLTSGPIGEELGWRGFAYNEFRRKFTLLKSAVILGILWGVWHLPLWILSGYTGADLIIYIITFMISITALSILISLFYDKQRNLFIPILMHFLFNFLLKIVSIDVISVLIYTSVFYTAAVVIFLLLRRTADKVN